MGKKLSKTVKEEFVKYDVNSKGYITKDDLKKTLMAQLTERVTEVENAKRTELNNKIKEKTNKLADELKTMLEVKDSEAKADQLTKVFVKNVDAIVHKAGAQKKAALQKTVDKRVETIVDKADSDKNGKIDYEEFKALAYNKDTRHFFEENLDLSTL